METIDADTLNKWKRKRQTTFIGYIIVGVIVGIDYSVVFSTLYLYLQKTLKTDNDNLYYGLIIASYAIASTLFGMVSGRWLDYTRKVKLFTNITLMLQIIGSILYVIPYHVAFPLIGRFIAGCGDPFTNVCTGEIIRTYNEEEGTRALWWLASCYSIGLIIGPVLPLMFNKVHFYIGPIEINQYNFIGIFMALLLLVAGFIVNFLMHDCSKELDLKEYLKDLFAVPDDTSTQEECKDTNEGIDNCMFVEEVNVTVINEDVLHATKTKPDHAIHNLPSLTQDVPDVIDVPYVHDSKPPSVKVTLQRLLSNIDVNLLFVSTFICMYSMFAVDVLVPLIIIEVLAWDLVALVVFLILSGVVYAFILFLMSKLCNSNKSLYIMVIVCLLSQILMFLMVFVIKSRIRNFKVDVMLIIFLGIFWLLTTCIEEVLIKAILAKMVPSSVQSFTESLRNGISSMSTIMAAITTPSLLPYLGWWSMTLIVISGLLLIAYVFRSKSLVHVKMIDFKNMDLCTCT